MLSVLAEKSWSAAQWAEKAGVAASTVQRAIKPGYDFVTSSKTLAKLASAAEVASPFSLTDDGAPGNKAKLVPIVGDVQAGLWNENFDGNHDHESLPFYDPQYERVGVQAWRVRGPSVNRVYPDGTFIYVAPAAEVGVRVDDFVVIRRTDVTGKTETTVKQVDIEDGRIVFWPRSFDPQFQKPFYPPDRDEEAQEGWEIIGVVVGSYQRAPARNGLSISFARRQ